MKRLIAVSVLAGLAILGGTAFRPSGNHPPQTNKFLTAHEVVTKVEQAELPLTINVHIIALGNKASRGFALVSFRDRGAVKYASLLKTDQGEVVNVFSSAHESSAAVQATQIAIGRNSLIAGVVVGRPDIARVGIQFPGDIVKEVSVSHGFFHFLGRATTPHGEFYSRIWGIRARG